jgi:succinate dehydrogenase / fumarate reductase, cytochrome b subunit
MLPAACQSSIGKKVLMAVTGLILFGFLVGHLAGNLLIFLGPEALNAYAKKLRDLGPLLWAARIVLLGSITVHVLAAIKLTVENRSARPISYECDRSIQTTYAAKTMLLSGFLIFAYIIYHLLHFTFHTVHHDITAGAHHAGDHVDVYLMVVSSFQNIFISGAYCVAMVVLGLHLFHGLSSMFQSLGLNDERVQCKLTWVARITAILISVGYISIPVAVLTGVVS